VAVYSTFLQRGFDGIVHDVALQDLPVVFAMDRAGVAGNDGATHHGVLDINYMLSVPGMTVTAPKDGAELLALLRLGIGHMSGPFSLRWPRDVVPAPVPPVAEIPELPYGSWEILREGKDLAILAVGTMVLQAQRAAEELSRDGIEVTVVNCRFLKPYDEAVLKQVLSAHGRILTVEEGAVVNGFGAFMAREMAGMEEARGVRVEIMGIPDHFVEHGGRGELLREIDLDARGIGERVRRLVGPRAAGQSAALGASRSLGTA
jgi:1-deoxy-D-xylulose-5-phosphate synthase